MRLGAWGEEVAARHLSKTGWRILARNYRAGRREIDLVASRGGVVAFVEVKTRSGTVFGEGSEAVTPAKQLAIASAAASWIHRHGDGFNAYRFDVISITRQRATAPRLEHLEDAWRIDSQLAHHLPEGVIFGFSI